MWLRQVQILSACLVFDKLAGHAVGLLYARRVLVLSSRLRHCWQRMHENELAASGGMRGRLRLYVQCEHCHFVLSPGCCVLLCVLFRVCDLHGLHCFVLSTEHIVSLLYVGVQALYFRSHTYIST
jgi:hypothetical protein